MASQIRRAKMRLAERTQTPATRQFILGRYIDEQIQMKTYVNTGSQPLAASVYT